LCNSTAHPFYPSTIGRLNKKQVVELFATVCFTQYNNSKLKDVDIANKRDISIKNNKKELEYILIRQYTYS
jgi:hypothetical protein